MPKTGTRRRRRTPRARRVSCSRVRTSDTLRDGGKSVGRSRSVPPAPRGASRADRDPRPFCRLAARRDGRSITVGASRARRRQPVRRDASLSRPGLRRTRARARPAAAAGSIGSGAYRQAGTVLLSGGLRTSPPLKKKKNPFRENFIPRAVGPRTAVT